MKASRRQMDRAFSCPIIVRSYREELARAYSNRARINRPVRPYSGHYALTGDCKFPSQPIGRQLGNLRLRTCDPPPIRRSTRLKPQYHSRAIQPGIRSRVFQDFALHRDAQDTPGRRGCNTILAWGTPTHWTQHRSPDLQPLRRASSWSASVGALVCDKLASWTFVSSSTAMKSSSPGRGRT